MLARRAFLTTAGAAMAAPAAAPPVRIERVEYFKVVVRMKPGVVLSENYGPTLDQRLADFDKYPHFIIKLHASNGHVGLGETGREVPEESVQRNAQFLTGKLMNAVDFGKPSLGLPEARTADGFEIALYDLMGKTAGVPVHALLGGGRQKKVAVSYWTAQRTIDDLIQVGETAVSKGFKNLKFKARFGDPIEQQMRAVARACPNLTFIVDFNSSYPDLASFLPVAQRLQGYNLTIEDPFPKRLDWFQQMRQRTTIPLALTPSGPAQMFDAIRMQACDVFNLGGDMRTFVRMCGVAEAAGIPAWHGSGVEMGIRDMSFIHAAAATTACTVPSDTLCYLRQHDLLAQPFKVVDGYIEVPDKPGLGVELDEDAVRKFRI